MLKYLIKWQKYNVFIFAIDSIIIKKKKNLNISKLKKKDEMTIILAGQ